MSLIQNELTHLYDSLDYILRLPLECIYDNSLTGYIDERYKSINPEWEKSEKLLYLESKYNNLKTELSRRHHIDEKITSIKYKIDHNLMDRQVFIKKTITVDYTWNDIPRYWFLEQKGNLISLYTIYADSSMNGIYDSHINLNFQNKTDEWEYIHLYSQDGKYKFLKCYNVAKIISLNITETEQLLPTNSNSIESVLVNCFKNIKLYKGFFNKDSTNRDIYKPLSLKIHKLHGYTTEMYTQVEHSYILRKNIIDGITLKYNRFHDTRIHNKKMFRLVCKVLKNLDKIFPYIQYLFKISSKCYTYKFLYDECLKVITFGKYKNCVLLDIIQDESYLDMIINLKLNNKYECIKSIHRDNINIFKSFINFDESHDEVSSESLEHLYGKEIVKMWLEYFFPDNVILLEYPVFTNGYGAQSIYETIPTYIECKQMNMGYFCIFDIVMFNPSGHLVCCFEIVHTHPITHFKSKTIKLINQHTQFDVYEIYTDNISKMVNVPGKFEDVTNESIPVIIHEHLQYKNEEYDYSSNYNPHKDEVHTYIQDDLSYDGEYNEDEGSSYDISDSSYDSDIELSLIK